MHFTLITINYYDPNVDIIKILKKVELITRDIIKKKVQIDILLQVAYILIRDKYDLWKKYMDDIFQTHSPYEILQNFHSFNINISESYEKDMLILIDSGDSKFNIFCE